MHLADQGSGAILILHGGAGEPDQRGDGLAAANFCLKQIVSEVYPKLAAGEDPLHVVQDCLAKMELSGLFTAGDGALPQADGCFRQSAAIMDGRSQRFSGVAGATTTIEPSRLALELQQSKYRVLGSPGPELLARKLGLEPRLPGSARTARCIETKLAQAIGSFGRDTVGCVVRTANGHLVAGTSTGGLSLAPPGRMSDAATVAGTYASRWLAVSATGIGEEIVDDALAARLDTRVRDGLPLDEASLRCFKEAEGLSRDYGWISVASDGRYAIGYLSQTMSYAVMDLDGVR